MFHKASSVDYLKAIPFPVFFQGTRSAVVYVDSILADRFFMSSLSPPLHELHFSFHKFQAFRNFVYGYI